MATHRPIDNDTMDECAGKAMRRYQVGHVPLFRHWLGLREWSWPRAVDSYGLEIQAAGAYLLS